MNKDLFAKQLSGNERDFFETFDKSMDELGVNIVYVGENIVNYKISPKSKHAVIRCSSKNGKLRAEIWLNSLENIKSYGKYIDDLPEHIKKDFREFKKCTFCVPEALKNCGMLREYIIDGKPYYAHSHGRKAVIDKFLPGDHEYYKQIVKHELSRVI